MDSSVTKQENKQILDQTDKLDIFVSTTHNKLDYVPTNKCYKIISPNKFEPIGDLENIFIDKNKSEVGNMFHSYCEVAYLKYARDNYDLKKYVGSAHYRRFFKFLDDIPDLDELFKTYDGILGVMGVYPTVLKQYANAHNIYDILQIIDIIYVKHNELHGKAIDFFFTKDFFFKNNVFIVKKETFCGACDFVMSVLTEFDKIRGFKTDYDVYKYVNEHSDIYQGGGNEYQSRICSFLGERLFSFYFYANLQNPLIKDIVLTSGKMV